MLTPTQQSKTNDAKNEIKRRIQQIISSGRHDVGAIKQALQDIWRGGFDHNRESHS